MNINHFQYFGLRSMVMLSVLLTLMSVGYAQQPDPQVVRVQSWKEGEGRITEQVLNIRLSREQPEYETTIQDSSGQRQYRLLLRHNPPTETMSEFWGVVFQEVLSQASSTKEKLKENLLSAGRPSPGRHSFTEGDNVGFLYPKESPNRYIDQSYFYPIRTKRVIRIENFQLIIQVHSYQVNEINPKNLNFLNLTVEFKNVSEKEASLG
jgi:hypothetical protein